MASKRTIADVFSNIASDKTKATATGNDLLKAVVLVLQHCPTALDDALELVAKRNGQTVELARYAFETGVPNVENAVVQLVVAAAVEMLNVANETAA